MTEWIGGRDVELVNYDIEFIDHDEQQGQHGTILRVLEKNGVLLVQRITDTDAKDGIAEFESFKDFLEEIKFFYDEEIEGLGEFLEEIRDLY